MNTAIRSDIKILDSLVALNLNISVWSARKKMCLEDFGGAELPPEDLASLGRQPQDIHHIEGPCLQLP